MAHPLRSAPRAHNLSFLRDGAWRARPFVILDGRPRGRHAAMATPDARPPLDATVEPRPSPEGGRPLPRARASADGARNHVVCMCSDFFYPRLGGVEGHIWCAAWRRSSHCPPRVSRNDTRPRARHRPATAGRCRSACCRWGSRYERHARHQYGIALTCRHCSKHANTVRARPGRRITAATNTVSLVRLLPTAVAAHTPRLPSPVPTPRRSSSSRTCTRPRAAASASACAT